MSLVDSSLPLSTPLVSQPSVEVFLSALIALLIEYGSQAYNASIYNCLPLVIHDVTQFRVIFFSMQSLVGQQCCSLNGLVLYILTVKRSNG